MEIRNFINGNFIDSISKSQIEVINPSNQELVGKIDEALDSEIDLAFSSARTAYKNRLWLDISARDKSKIMRDIASKLRKYKKQGGKLLSSENGKTINKVSKLNGTLGILNSGNPPDTEAKSPTVNVSILSIITKKEIIIIDTKGDGSNFPNLGSFGTKKIIPIVKSVNNIMIKSWFPWSQPPLNKTFIALWLLSDSWEKSGDLNWPIWLKNITIANPFTNPNITGVGTILINLPNRRIPIIIWIIPVRIIVANRYWTP